MSSCLSGVSSPSPSARSSSPSSTLSESSNTPRRISTKRGRTPRKRPNQTYTEAAALLSTVHPKVFSTNNLGKLYKHTRSFSSFTESSDLLPTFSVLGDSGCLINQPVSEKPNFVLKPVNSLHRSLPSKEFRQPESPELSDDGFDAESILDEEIEEGIDSIMGNLSMSNNEEPMSCNAPVNPYLRSLVGFGLVGKLELGFGFGGLAVRRNNIRRALRHVDEGEWWRSPKVSVSEIAPKFNALPQLSTSSEKKKKKKVVKELTTASIATTVAPTMESLRSSLLLKLNYVDVAKEWSDRGSPFTSEDGVPESTTDILARLAEIDLSLEGGSATGGGVREASVMRYKEKRRSRLSTKKIRYEVRKVNADKRPRMKGRFVKSPSLLQEAIDEMSQ